MVFELWFAGEDGGNGEGEDGSGKDADAFSIFTSLLDAGFGSHLAFSKTMLANRKNTSTIAVFLPHSYPASEIHFCTSS